MLQCGGNNNVSAALLKEFFLHEQKNEEHFRRACKSPRTSPRVNKTGILPCITQHTDIASLRRSPRSRNSGRAQTEAGSMSESIARHYGTPSPSSRGKDQQGLDSPRLSSSRLRDRHTPNAFDLPNKGIGHNVPNTPSTGSVPSSPRGKERPPRHGRAPPYNKRITTSEFYDNIQANGIACLCPQATLV